MWGLTGCSGGQGTSGSCAGGYENQTGVVVKLG